jgi:hypothetical protein
LAVATTSPDSDMLASKKGPTGRETSQAEPQVFLL